MFCIQIPCSVGQIMDTLFSNLLKILALCAISIHYADSYAGDIAASQGALLYPLFGLFDEFQVSLICLITISLSLSIIVTKSITLTNEISTIRAIMQAVRWKRLYLNMDLTEVGAIMIMKDIMANMLGVIIPQAFAQHIGVSLGKRHPS